jgi:hypothetical protein
MLKFMSYIKSFVFLFAILLSLNSYSQFIGDEEPEYAEEETTDEQRKFFFGGNLGLVFGNYTYINISPTVGYRLRPNLATGGGVVFEYVNDRTGFSEYSTAIYGLKLFAQSILFENLILYGETNFLSMEKQYFDAANNYPPDGRFLLNVPWLGGGYYQKVGNGGTFFMILFNMNKTTNSPYPPYEFRIGINF